MTEPTEAELRAAHAWEADDRVSRPEMTAFRRRARYHQSLWREAHGHPMGTIPPRPKPGNRARRVGSRLPIDYAMETGANFLTPDAVAAVHQRLARKEPNQSLDRSHLWADLLWGPALAFNLFGDVATDPKSADRAVHQLWPDVPGTVVEVRFEHSPGWLDPEYLGNLSSFNAAFVLQQDDGSHGILAVETPYHERVRREIPKPTRLAHYIAVMNRSGVFAPDALAAVNATDLVVMWLQHLLLHSMLQHPSGEWSWGRLVIVHPAENADFVDACRRYEALLTDHRTFASMTLEQLLASKASPAQLRSKLRERYLFD